MIWHAAPLMMYEALDTPPWIAIARIVAVLAT
jgi:hypothetical protein